MVKDMGGDETFIKRYVEGSWDDISTANHVIPPVMIEQAIDKVLPTVHKPVMGVDVAREGLDETVIYYGMNYKLIDWEYLRSRKTDETVMRILDMSKRHRRPIRVAVDDIGVGGGVVDFLKRYGSSVVGVNVGRRSEDKRFYNLKAEIWWHARNCFMEGKVSIPNDEKLVRQLGAVQYRYRGTGKIIVEPKDETRKRLGQSPDRADAFVLMLWAARGVAERSSDFARYPAVAAAQNHGDAYGWSKHYGSDAAFAPTYQY
jgi:phage terminase large subunit